MSAPVVGRVGRMLEGHNMHDHAPDGRCIRQRDFHERAAIALSEIGQQMAEALQDLLAESRPCRSTHSRICKCSIQRLLNLWDGR